METGKGATTIYVDNKAAIDLSKNRSSHDSTKHIEARFYYIRDLIEDGSISVQHVPTTDNPSDILTKALPRDTFVKHRQTLGITAPQDIESSGSVKM